MKIEWKPITQPFTLLTSSLEHFLKYWWWRNDQCSNGKELWHSSLLIHIFQRENYIPLLYKICQNCKKKILKHTFKQLSRMYFVLSSSAPSLTNVFHPQDMGDFTRVSYPQVNHPFPLPSDGAWRMSLSWSFRIFPRLQ